MKFLTDHRWVGISGIVGILALIVAILALLPRGEQAPAASPTAAPQTSSGYGWSTSGPSASMDPSTPPAQDAGSAYLSELVPLRYDSAVAEPAVMGGVTYVRAVAMSSGGCGGNQNTSYDWVVNSQYTTLSTVVGLDDRTVADASVQVQILLDGRPAFNQTFRAGAVVPVELDVSAARQITFEQTYLGPKPNICSRDATVVWGDPLLKKV